MFVNIKYLKNGNDRQIKSYFILTKIKLFEKLKKYKPILVGTIPIGIDTKSSDLDIICEVYDFYEFRKLIEYHFNQFKGFKINIQRNVLVCNFCVEDEQIEIYATNKKTTEQNGYKHMVVEHKLLQFFGYELRNKVLKYKENGIKTEPAFCKALKLEGNPYEILLEINI